MAKKRIIKDYPRLDKKIQSFDDVADYLTRLTRSLNENRPKLFQGDVFVETREPTANDGQDGDIWIQTV